MAGWKSSCSLSRLYNIKIAWDMSSLTFDHSLSCSIQCYMFLQVRVFSLCSFVYTYCMHTTDIIFMGNFLLSKESKYGWLMERGIFLKYYFHEYLSDVQTTGFPWLIFSSPCCLLRYLGMGDYSHKVACYSTSTLILYLHREFMWASLFFVCRSVWMSLLKIS